MKCVIYSSIVLALLAGARADTEVWYDWQGRRVGELPTEFPSKMQPQDLVVGEQALIRIAAEPWNVGQRTRRLGDWYRSGYDYRNGGSGWGVTLFPSCLYRSYAPRQSLQFWYRCGGSWGVNFQRPGVSLQWRH